MELSLLVINTHIILLVALSIRIMTLHAASDKFYDNFTVRSTKKAIFRSMFLSTKMQYCESESFIIINFKAFL